MSDTCFFDKMQFEQGRIGMKTIIMEYQSFILFILSAVALFVAAFTALIKFHVVKMKSLLIRVI